MLKKTTLQLLMGCSVMKSILCYNIDIRNCYLSLVPLTCYISIKIIILLIKYYGDDPDTEELLFCPVSKGLTLKHFNKKSASYYSVLAAGILQQ